MLFKPTIPGMYKDPSIALDSFVLPSKNFMCISVNVGFNRYFISSKEESREHNF